MRVSNVLNRFRQGGAERDRAVREIGLELSKRRIETVSELRAGIAQIERDADEFSRGYRQAVLDVLAAYEAAISQAGHAERSLMRVELP